MKKYILNKPILYSCLIFLICLIIRIFEYFVIKTDETLISENFIHKVLGIIILIILLNILNYKFKDIGFKKKNFLKYLSYGLLLGLLCFGVAYFIEFFILYSQAPHFEIYVNGFSLTGTEVKHTELIFFILCIVMNILNVVMEEGMFRGLFLKIINNKRSFLQANLIVALLFGVWHFVMPLRSFIYGEMNFMSLFIMMIGYIILSGIMSFKWGLLYQMTDSLFIGIGDHLFNNIIATNLIHIVTISGADELQIVRIMIAQILSFVIIYMIYRKNKEKLYS